MISMQKKRIPITNEVVNLYGENVPLLNIYSGSGSAMGKRLQCDDSREALE